MRKFCIVKNLCIYSNSEILVEIISKILKIYIIILKIYHPSLLVNKNYEENIKLKLRINNDKICLFNNYKQLALN